MNRYQELKKENNELLLTLGDSYQRLADIYIKKARGFATRTEDTEVKIKDTLYILKEYSDQGILCSIAIPNESEFIEGRVKLLSKQYKDPDMVKGWIILSLLIVATIIWVAVGQYLGRKVYFEEPTNFVVKSTEGNKVTLSWDQVELAGEYSLYYTVDGNTSSTYRTDKLEYTFTLEYGKTYTFYVFITGTDYFGESSKATITYTLENNK